MTMRIPSIRIVASLCALIISGCTDSDTSGDASETEIGNAALALEQEANADVNSQIAEIEAQKAKVN
jgi:hypothetical protein